MKTYSITENSYNCNVYIDQSGAFFLILERYYYIIWKITFFVYLRHNDLKSYVVFQIVDFC